MERLLRRVNLGCHFKEMKEASYDDEFVKDLFDRMGPTYAVTNLISSFGFSEFWRRSCVDGAKIQTNTTVCDMMAGAGECWRYIPQGVSRIVSIDFSSFMSNRQKARKQKDTREIEVLCENALSTSLDGDSIDHVVSAFGLKTLSAGALAMFANELFRVLKPGGTISLLEISVPGSALLRVPYMWYISNVVPWIGKTFLGDIECYRLLGEYTEEFQSCAGMVRTFEEAGLTVTMKRHFFGVHHIHHRRKSASHVYGEPRLNRSRQSASTSSLRST